MTSGRAIFFLKIQIASCLFLAFVFKYNHFLLSHLSERKKRKKLKKWKEIGVGSFLSSLLMSFNTPLQGSLINEGTGNNLDSLI